MALTINHISWGFFLSLLSKPTPNSAALLVPHQILRLMIKKNIEWVDDMTKYPATRRATE